MLVGVLPDGGGAADGPNVAIGLAEQDFPTTSAPGHQVRPHPAPGLGSPLPHLHRDWARPGHICRGTGLTHATSAPGLCHDATGSSGVSTLQTH